MLPVTKKAEIVKRGILRVGTTGDYKPFSYRASANSPFVGADIEMAQRLARRLQVKLELVPTTWSGLMPDLAADKFDIAMGGISISEERAKQAYFSLPYLRDGKTPITRCDEVARYQSLAQIDQASTRVIVNPGGTNHSFVTQNIKSAQVQVYPDNNTIFDQIAIGKADVMLTDAIEARLQHELKPSLCAVHPEQTFTVSFKAYLLPQDREWKAYVDQWLREEASAPEPETKVLNFNAHVDKWLHHPWPRTHADAISFDPLRDLMVQRLNLMEDVAKHKWNQGLPIEDLQREQQVVANLGQQAAALGISPAWAEAFFRAQIEAAKQLQSAYFEQWQRQGITKFENVVSLEQVTRPKLDQLTGQLLQELARTWPGLLDQRQHSRLLASMQRISASQAISSALQTAQQPLVSTQIAK
ncbi:gamma subclass chorismate mutase AroQ [Undibacterium cyanobacteriorum]|uniref:chorismate mutase n=2 Tax=Undibacterium cyanobacteriorum TaxID=3073561 RepID=A0ABY9RIK4_9BURK|nr:gamma subclass chorismate mutase AroQ [Undibacterium sp. 20NA77.5]WMW80776.1 gamma subclass chorismate mutase AroQ [Undibacterium sp. 20NA77.5]